MIKSEKENAILVFDTCSSNSSLEKVLKIIYPFTYTINIDNDVFKVFMHVINKVKSHSDYYYVRIAKSNSNSRVIKMEPDVVKRI